jgi:hypothetical protein
MWNRGDSFQLVDMSDLAIHKITELESELIKAPQVPIDTKHNFHAGVYARTIMIPRGVALTGALIKIPTLLIIQGNCIVTMGETSEVVQGYNVIPASLNRKTAYYAYDDTFITMLFATDASSVEEAENEFTDEVDRLMSRQPQSVNLIEGE